MHQIIEIRECQIIGCRKPILFHNMDSGLCECEDHNIRKYHCRTCHKLIEVLSYAKYKNRCERYRSSITVDLNLEYCDNCWNSKMRSMGI